MSEHVLVRDLVIGGYCTPACLLALVDDGVCACRCKGEGHGLLIDARVDFTRQSPAQEGTAGLGDRSAEIFEYVLAAGGPVEPREVAESLGLPDARRYLARMAASGRLWRGLRGQYMAPQSGLDAASWIAGYLDTRGGCAPAAEVLAAGQSAGHSAKTLRNARHRVASTRRTGFGPGSYFTWEALRGQEETK